MADDRIFGEDDEPRRLPGAGRGLAPRGPDSAVDVWRPERVVDEPAIDLAQTVAWYVENRDWWQAIRDKGFHSERLGLTKA